MTVSHQRHGMKITLVIHRYRSGITWRMNVRITSVCGVHNFRSGYAGSQCEFQLSVCLFLHGNNLGFRNPVIASFIVQTGIMMAQTVGEVLVVTPGHLAPCHFRNSQQTREGQIFGIVFRTVFIQQGQFLQYSSMNKLVTPEASLYTQNRRFR